VEGLAFQDIYSFDDEMLAMLPQPTEAVVLIFPGGEREDQSSAPPLPPGSPFFLYQIAGLGNACGTIAAIHSVANSEAAASLAEGTTLKTFLDTNA
jgi:ubiquitin carboxyl-terminal hydrolase L3